MGNTQGNQNDNKNISEKQRNRPSTVRGRVLAKFKSRNSLPTKDIVTVEPLAVVNCDNEFTNIQTARVKKDVVYETADIHSSENIDKRISQISQGADSAKDALDYGKFKLLFCVIRFVIRS